MCVNCGPGGDLGDLGAWQRSGHSIGPYAYSFQLSDHFQGGRGGGGWGGLGRGVWGQAWNDGGGGGSGPTLMACLKVEGGQNQKWLPHPCILEDPQQKGQNHNWMPHPCLLKGIKLGGNATSPLHSRGSPTKGTKSELATSPLPSRGLEIGRKCYITPAFSGISNKGGTMRIGCLIPKRKCYITPTFSGIPNKGDKIRIDSPPYLLTSTAHTYTNTKTNTEACYFTGTGDSQQRGQNQNWQPHPWAEVLHNPNILGDPQQRGQHQDWLPHLCLLRGPKVGTNAT